MIRYYYFLFTGLFLFSSAVRAQETHEQEWVLPPVIAEGTPADALKYDPITPAIEGTTAIDSGTGGISHSLTNQLPFHMADNGRAGNIATFVGLGTSSEETDVSAFGIPLNSPQGGGFDFSTFPQYLWSGFTFQTGPSLGAFDPRAVAGSLSLTPWTQQALTTKSSGARLIAFDTTEHVQQISVAGKSGGEIAAVAGMSTGDVTGPAGSISGRWGSGNVTGKYHLIATDQHVTNIKSFHSSSTGEQTTWRYIPVVQMDVKTGTDSLLKNSFFYDSTYLRSDQGNIHTRAQVRQGGIESAYLYRDWKFGLGARQLDYHSHTFTVPTEQILNLTATKGFLIGDELLVSPTIQATEVSDFGFYPAGSLGIRKGFGNATSNQAIFARASYSKRFPSLADRYYYLPPFAVGNPNLQPETAYTYTLGTELKSGNWETSLEGYAQYRQQARYYQDGMPGMEINAGNAHVYALTHTLAASPVAWFTGSNKLTLTSSYVDQTKGPFTYMPGTVDVLSGDFHQAALDPKWAFSSTFRTSSSFNADQTTILSGYGYMDIGGRVRLYPGVDLHSSIENLFNRPIELIRDSPTDGRIYTVTLVGTL